MSRLDDETFQVKFNVIPETRMGRFAQLFPGLKDGLVKSEPGNFVTTPEFGMNADKIYYRQPKKEDVWLTTFPKCGKKKLYIILYSM